MLQIVWEDVQQPLATVVDSKYSNVVLSIEERQTSLNNMIKLALEAIIK